MMKSFGRFLLALGAVAFSSSAYADDGVTQISNQACEKINPNDSKSAVRVRATDKANFLAVGRLSSLNKARETLDEHNFNVLVYNIVDEFVEDLNVKTISQNDEEICVEISGYVNDQNVSKAFENYMNDDEVPLAQEDNVKAVAEKVNEVIPVAVESETSKPSVEVSMDAVEEDETKKSLVYIEPVEFYNNTTSEKYADLVKKQFDNNSYFSLTSNKNTADYVVKPKVLKVKADAINQDTSRLQMVLSLAVKGVKEKMEITEFQNRFVLFSKDENEQAVAKNLMQKLFKTAGQKVLARIESNERKKGNYLPEVITPVKPGSGSDSSSLK